MKISKKALKTLMLFLFVMIFLGTSASVYAKDKVTDKQYKKVMKAYKMILSDNPYKKDETGFVANYFSFYDLDKNGVPELIINGDAPQIFTYDLKEGKTKYIYNSWGKETLYFSPDTDIIMNRMKSSGEIRYYFMYMNYPEDRKESSIIGYFPLNYVYIDGTEKTVDIKKGYYEVALGEKMKYKKITKKETTEALDYLMPNKIELKTDIKNTKANRTKYLDDIKLFKTFAFE